MSGQGIELYYEIAALVMDNGEMLFASVCFCFLCRGFFREKKTLWMIGIIHCLAQVIQYYIPVYMGGMCARAVAGAVSLILMLFVEKEVTPQIKVYLACIFFSLWDLSTCTSVELYCLIGERRDVLMYEWYMSGRMPNADLLYFLAYFIFTFLMFAGEFVLLIFFSFLVDKAFYDKRGRYGWKEIGILLIPSVAGLAVRLLRKTYEALFLEVSGQDILDFYGSRSSVALLLSLCYLTTLVIIVMELYLFQGFRKEQEKEKSWVLLQSQMQDIQSHITEVERIYKGIRGVRHDLNNHVHVISGLLERKQYAEATQYLKKMQDTADNFDFSCKTGNPITDVIINEKYQQAKQEGITFHSEFHFATDTSIDDFDMSIILNNILQNAFEAACKANCRERVVSIHSERKKNAYFIIVTNPCNTKLRFGENGLPESEKEDRSLHGVGLQNVKAAVEKYFGTLVIEEEDSMVTLTVMLMLK